MIQGLMIHQNLDQNVILPCVNPEEAIETTKTPQMRVATSTNKMYPTNIKTNILKNQEIVSRTLEAQ